MNKYINILKKYYIESNSLKLSSLEDSYLFDDTILDSDIDFSYYDDDVICDKNFLDDTLYYID